MTYKEALTDLKSIHYNHFGLFTNDEPAWDLAFHAIEKQIPKKPDYEGGGYGYDGEIIYDTWICPTCGEHYEMDYAEYDFCPNCGQAIDWSNTK